MRCVQRVHLCVYVVAVLMEAAGTKLDDIVQGKSGGVFIVAEGIPGTGKTLTAELSAEAMSKALYTVQCSQLGINPEQIEKRLRQVLARAERWGAVLLLDEADVYIRARGTDVDHNAIVGVMLRVIERYSGILFMTTNLPDIDDAVMSRATAHFHYTRPGEKLLAEIWMILSKQFGYELDTKQAAHCAEKWPLAVGRDVKNMLKLARLATTKDNSRPKLDVLLSVSKYLSMNQKVEIHT